MSEEEAREALKIMKENIDKKYLRTRNSVAIETALSLLKEKDRIIKDQSKTNKKLRDKLHGYRRLLKLKEKHLNILKDKLIEKHYNI